MKARTFVPRKLDIGAFIEAGETLSGALAPTALPRLADGLAKDADLVALPELTWSAQGRLVPQRTGGPEMWLDLQAHAELAFECQRCLHAVALPVRVQRSIRFAKDEAAAAELDIDSEDDVLALSRQFDLIELIEDEIIMAQPLVPRHDACPTDVAALMGMQAGLEASPTPLPDGASAGGELTASGRPNPFAVLASLKKGKP